MEIKKVCVCGTGQMGRQIALDAALHGFEVSLYSRSQESGAKAEKWVLDYLDKGVSKGWYTAERAESTRGLFKIDTVLETAAGDAQLIIESVVEKLEAKRELFQRLGKIAPPEALFTSNSSYLPSSRFADVTGRPDKTANLHYFNPPTRIRLVEIVRGPHTSDETVEALKAFAAAIEKETIVVQKEIDGFVVNRLLKAVQSEGFYLLENGIASFEEIDRGAEMGLGYPLGPFRLMDFTGIDITYMNRLSVYEASGDEALKPPRALEEHYLRGEYGRKTGKGWYSY